ncbi:hypothetical protein tb265_41550 [Gemmatimonadetes bacterium T265]|nr:hypothetical protein tb265_41550 [Gemmatimonadetes bacterium T265]
MTASAAGAARRGLPRRADHGPAPLSFAQERLWFVHQLDPSRGGASTPLALRLDGPLDVAAFRGALDAVVARHAALRTRVAVDADGVPWQVVEPDARVPIAAEALPPNADGVDAALAARLGAELRRPFDLARAPLARALLLRVAPESHVAALVVHHLVFDAWSRGIVRRELAAAYGAIVRGDAWAPAPLPVEFADFAAWQRREDAEPTLATDEAYWVDALAGAPLVLPLPADGGGRRGPGAERVGVVAARLPDALAAAVRAFARREGATPFMVLLAAYEAVLARYTGADDFLVGVVVSGRTRTETESVVGCFVNTLPFRARVDGDPSARALLARVRTAAAHAFAHQAVPFERLVARLNPARGGTAPPLVQATFNFRNLSSGGFAMPGLVVTVLDVPAPPQTAGLSLDVDDGPDGMRGVLSYDAGRIGAAAAEGLLADFAAVLEAAVTNPDAPLSATAPAVVQGPVETIVTPAGAAVAPARAAFDALYARTNLTATQLLMWVHAQVYAEVPLYNQAALRIWEEPADVAAFGRAFAALVARSEALRTTVAERDGVPWQTVHAADARPAVWEVLDFSGRPDPLAALRAWAAERVAVPLDLSRRSYDSVLVRLGPTRTAWYFATHHVVSDGWLRVMFLRELYEDYRAERSGAPVPARRPPPPFADVVAAERAAAGTERSAGAPCGGAPCGGAPCGADADPGDPVRPYGGSPRGGVGPVSRVRVPLGAERTTRVRAVAASVGGGALSADAAAANLCAAVLGATLHRVGGGSSVLFGVPVHNRRADAARRTHGLLMRVLPVRVPLHGGVGIDALARAVGEATVDAAARADPAAGTMAAAGADAVFNFHPPGPARLALESVEWLHPGWAAESLAVSVDDYGATGALTLTADFRTDVYDAPTRALFVRHLLAVLDAALADPSTRVGDVELLSAEDRRRVFDVPNDTAAPPPGAATVVDLVCERAAATPDAPAVSQPGAGGAGCTLTYAALVARAERVAAGLGRLGVGPGDCVGLVLGRSPELIVAMLGVLRAGAAYVPLDPAYPAGRLALMAEQAGLALALAERGACDRIPPRVARTVCFDALDAECGGAAAAGPSAPRPARDDLAYVIFTSGSTGTPKGVEITHAALLNFSADVARRFALGPGDRFLQFASPSFDTAVEEIFPTLVAGAAVVLRDDAWIGSIPEFVARCAESRITAFSLPTAFWHELADALARGAVAPPAGLRLALVGGERMRADRLADWRRAVGARVLLWNGYGPTEATVVTHFCDLTPAPGAVEPGPTDDAPAAGDVPIGAPIANMRAYVLDAARRPAPLGVPGELYVGGIGLARGYRGQPGLTADRFVADPFAPGERLYRTGDLACFRPDGRLEVVGRVDAQVKVRGFRVEPGEVEAVLFTLPDVRDAAVVARDDAGAGPRLVAYVVPRGAGPPPPELRETVLSALQARLPEYLVPSAVVVLGALPKTPNGKVDRRALPDPGAADVGAAEYVPPRSASERAVAAVWEELLGVPRVGVTDDFFRLGGHSLLAVRMLARVAAVTGRTVPITAFYGGATLGQLSARLYDDVLSAARAEHAELVLPLRPAGDAAPLFWWHQDYGGGGLYCRRLADLLGPDQPFYVMHPLGMFGDGVPLRLEAIAERHLAALRAVRPSGPYRLGGLCIGGAIAFEVARRLRAAGEVVEGVVIVDGLTRPVRRPALRRLRLRASRPVGAALRRWLGREGVPDAAAVRDAGSRQAALDAIYAAASWTYVPRAYAGRVVALAPAEATAERRAALERGWRRVAREFEVHVIPGDHLSCVTVHADALAARLRETFAEGGGAREVSG